MNLPNKGRPRRGEWNTLTPGVFLTLGEVADHLCIKRTSIRSQLNSRRYKLPDYIEVVKENNRTIGVIRHAQTCNALQVEEPKDD